MKILLLSDWMSNRGGAESYILSLRDSLREQGDDVRLLACGPRVPGGLVDTPAYGSDSFAAQALMQIVNPFAVSSVRRLVREFKPDAAVVSQFAYHLSPAVFGALGQVPTVVTMMDYKAICPTGTRLLPSGSYCSVQRGAVCTRNGCIGYAHSLRDRTRYSRIGRELSAARRVLCPSSSMQREFRAAGIEATLVPLGIRPSAQLAGEPAKDPVFAYVGRFSREKGVAVLLAAFSRLINDFPRATLRLIGDGPLKSNLVALAAVLGITDSVTFCGWSDSQSMNVHLDDAWCVVCPSLWAEPFGLAAVESVSRGIPVIASDSGGFRETVSDATGILVKAGDAGALASAMRSIADRQQFVGSRLSTETVENARHTHGMTEHTRRVRGILSEMVQPPA